MAVPSTGTRLPGSQAGGPLSLQRRLMQVVLGLVGFVWLVVLTATWLDTEHEVGELLDGHLTQAASLLVSLPLDDLTRLDMPETPVLHQYQSKTVFQVWHDQELVVRSATAPGARLAMPNHRGMEEVAVEGEMWRVFSAQGRDPHVVVQVAERLSARTDVVWASLFSVIWPMAVALPLLAVLVWWAVRHTLQPLHTLSEAVSQRRPDAADPLPLEDVPGEVRPLVLALNRLFARMRAVLDNERRFTADAAHELRTPIAAIRVQAQVAQGATCEAERDQALAATLTGCDRATHLVSQLLELARLDAPAAGGGHACDLQMVLKRVMDDERPAALHSGHSLRYEIDHSSSFRCPVPAGLMGTVVRNLVDNALRYSPPHGEVRLAAESLADGSTALVVEDSGPGLSAPDLERLGERFFRVMGSGQPGSGLGWSIIRRVADLYGLHITTDRSPSLGGLRVHIRWTA
jgi:two-component system, OmpR family, sensor histidine kinase QseC